MKLGLTLKAIKSYREPTLTYSLRNGKNMKVGMKWFKMLLEKVESAGGRGGQWGNQDQSADGASDGKRSL